jgi:hypothetical protein
VKPIYLAALALALFGCASTSEIDQKIKEYDETAQSEWKHRLDAALANDQRLTELLASESMAVGYMRGYRQALKDNNLVKESRIPGIEGPE